MSGARSPWHEQVGVPLVASNDVHYHDPERYRLQHALVAARLNTTMEQALFSHQTQPPPAPEVTIPDDRSCSVEIPDALSLAALRDRRDTCEFNLASDLGYTLPEPAVPSGYTSESYLQTPLRSEAARAPLWGLDPGGRVPA